MSSPPSFYFLFHLKNILALHIREKRERERRDWLRPPPLLVVLPTNRLRSDRLFFFFSYLLVLIQLYFKNWILFCILCLDYVRNGVRSACSFFLFSYLLVLIQLYFKNWILFCVLCLDYVRNGIRLACCFPFLFFLFFFHICLF